MCVCVCVSVCVWVGAKPFCLGPAEIRLWILKQILSI